VSDENTLHSTAFPALVRVLAVALTAALAVSAVWSLPALRSANWTHTGLAVLALSALCVAWVGYWIVFSRTRLDGDVLVQTWLWDKRVNAGDVAQLKLVHWRPLDGLMAPRLLVRRRNGGITWFQSADARLLTAFGERVAARSMPAAAP
jgi:hypothetical protein